MCGALHRRPSRSASWKRACVAPHLLVLNSPPFAASGLHAEVLPVIHFSAYRVVRKFERWANVTQREVITTVTDNQSVISKLEFPQTVPVKTTALFE